MESVAEILNKFTPIGLDKLETVGLLDRVDTKYVFSRSKLSHILNSVTDHYYILEVNDLRTSEYSSLYFDTPDFELYKHHLTGRLSRFKVRYREYVRSGLKFFEIKHKNNKSRTIKYRMPQQEISDLINDSAAAFLMEKTEYLPGDLSAKLWVNYTRITLMSKTSHERVTIDTDLIFRSGDVSKEFPDLVIAEVKQNRSGKSYFKKIMKDNRIRRAALSKYCLGIVNLFDNVRKNNFKTKLNLIKKIQNGVTASFERT